MGIHKRGRRRSEGTGRARSVAKISEAHTSEKIMNANVCKQEVAPSVEG